MDIKREELLNSLKDFTLRGNGIVIGLPGVGKTYIIKELEKSLNINELSAVYLRVDRLANCTNDDLRAIFSFKGDFIENLHKQKPVSGKRFVIFFDGFDAMRNEVGRENLLILIHKSLIELKDDWNVIVSVRTYDAHKSQALLALFDKPLSDDEEIYKDKNIPCRHFEIKPLTETEIEDGLNQIHFPNELFLQSSDDFKSLLSIPFNLLLLEKYRYLGGKFSDLSNVKTEVHLLNSYWNIRSNNANDLNLQDLLLERITHKMVDQRTLTINKNQVVDSHTSLIADRLLSDGVLEKVDSKGQEIGFSHNILFDYAANVYQLNNDINVLVGYLNNDLSKMVFLLPGLSFHFTEMYYENPKAFWDSYRFLISNSNIHLKLLGRVIFTTVIVNETYSIKQLQSIIDFPKDLLNIMYKSMIYILQAIRALNSKRLDLWISFLENINFFSDISIAWEVSLLIRWMYDQNNNEIDVVARIGTLARKLLDWVQTNQGNKYDLNRLGARVLTPLVANTFSTNPQESKSLLGNILNNIESPDYPIDYIYEITNHVKDYWTSSPEFVEQIYQKIFGHKEISDEITEFGSPILPLRSNRRQDFSMCQYLLIWAFKDFLASSPLKAISAGVKAIDSYIIRERVNPLMNHDESSTTQSEEEFHFFGSKAVFICGGAPKGHR